MKREKLQNKILLGKGSLASLGEKKLK